MTGDDAPEAKERLTRLFLENSTRVRLFASRRVGPDDAQEIVSETFLVAWRRIDDVPDHPLPWLYRVASFEIANHRRRQEKHSHLELSMVDESRHISRQSAHDRTQDLSEAVSAAFFALKSEDQEVLRLATWEQLSTVDGARAFGCSTAAYRVRLHRARVRLARSAGLRGRSATARFNAQPVASRARPVTTATATDGPTEETEAM
jgi:RNA polymerase sigma factor (sigma-70 family)